LVRKYDVIIALGRGLTDNWKLPEIVVSRLKVIVEIYKKGKSNKIIVSGKWSINWDLNGVKPPTTEAEEMKTLLLELGVPDSIIFKEEWSKDTIGNAYFSKVKILKPNNYNYLLVVCADFRIKRVKFLFEKVLGEEYKIEYLTTPTKSINDKKFMKIQEHIFKAQSKFLEKMELGDDIFLKSKLYDDAYYKKKRPSAEAKISMKGSN